MEFKLNEYRQGVTDQELLADVMRVVGLVDQEPEEEVQERTDNPIRMKRVSRKRTSRNINLKMRFAVLQRDSFVCRSCGASPAKNPGVELHIDHIVPWSRGGETEIENLQTLCSKCNYGKSSHGFS